MVHKISLTKELLFGNSGNGPQTNFSFYDSSSDQITFQTDVMPAYVQYCITDNQFAYLAATDSVYKYDWFLKV